MSSTLADLAQLVGGQLHGPGHLEISGAATLEIAQAGQISLADCSERAAQLACSAAAAAVISSGVECPAKPTIVVDNVHEAFTQIVRHFRPERSKQRSGVSSQAMVSATATLDEDVDIHPHVTIGDDVTVGRGTTVHAGVHILAGATIGNDVTIYPNVVIYENCRIGDRTIIHAGAVIGAYGFGYHKEGERHILSSQLGHVEISADVEIGAGTTIDRGTYGPTLIGAGTKIDNLVQIAHNCRIGKHNLICSQVGIAGSTSTGDHVVMAGQVGIRDHVHIGSGAVLCSQAGVSNDIKDKEIVLGSPATDLRKQKLQMAAISKLPEMRKQFRQLQKQIGEVQQQLGGKEKPSSNERAA